MTEQSHSPLDPTPEPDAGALSTPPTEAVPTEAVPTEAVPPQPVAPPQQPVAPPPPSYAASQPSYTAPQPPPPGSGYPPPAPMAQGAHYGQASAQLQPETEKQVGALAHGIGAAATFFSGGTLGFIAALVMYFVYRDRGPFVRAHVANALNVQIMVGIGLVISALLMMILVGFITYPIVWIVGVVLHIVGAVKAMNGEYWKPPMTPDFVK